MEGGTEGSGHKQEGSLMHAHISSTGNSLFVQATGAAMKVGIKEKCVCV